METTMRYEKGHKAATRQHIIDVAASRFRRDGVAASGLATVMADAGLTNGAFYSHFDSKDDLVRETVITALEKRKKTLREAAAEPSGMERVIRDYLSPRHRDDPGNGCPTSALVAEIARHPAATRDAFTARVGEVIDLMAALLPGAADRRQAAMALYAMMIGTLQLARAVNDAALSDEILRGGRNAALALAGYAES
jgi:AcrR family transcriptional regulator